MIVVTAHGDIRIFKTGKKKKIPYMVVLRYNNFGICWASSALVCVQCRVLSVRAYARTVHIPHDPMAHFGN